MNKLKQIKPWKFYFKVFLFFTFYVSSFAQNKLITEIDINDVNTISINGDQIFFIGVKATNTSDARITSIIDGEYENNYQIITNKVDNVLNINLEQIVFSSISDDKRNAHKVIAAKLLLEIPENMNLNIKSDIASVGLEGYYDTISIQLYQGYCKLLGSVERATINTIGKYYKR